VRSADDEGSGLLLGPGRFFGEISILRDTPRVFTLVARTDVVLLSMERDEFQELVAQSLGTTGDFADVLRSRLRAFTPADPSRA
jgi:CRP-like cAMP-binding protein